MPLGARLGYLDLTFLALEKKASVSIARNLANSAAPDQKEMESM
jgi:hypothetical protein